MKYWIAAQIIQLSPDTSTQTAIVAPHKKHWHSSRGLAKPIYTEPEPAAEDEIAPLKDAVTKDYVLNYDDEYGLMSAYRREVVKTPLRIAGGHIVLPEKAKRRKAGKIE